MFIRFELSACVGYLEYTLYVQPYKLHAIFIRQYLNGTENIDDHEDCFLYINQPKKLSSYVLGGIHVRFNNTCNHNNNAKLNFTGS